MSGSARTFSSLSLVVVVLVFQSLALVMIKETRGASVVTPRKPKAEHNHGQNCTDHLQTIDRCSSLATYSYTTNFNKYPIDGVEMKASCERIGDGLKCLKTHGKCLSSVARRSLNSFASARSRHSKRLCANLNDAKTIEFINSSECITRSNKKTLMIALEKELISAIQFLSNNGTMKWEARFHSACCAASSYKIKVLKEIEPECSKFREAQEEMVNSMIGELLESACPEANRLKEICAKIPKLTLAKEWRSGSLTRAALDLIVELADTSKDVQ